MNDFMVLDETAMLQFYISKVTILTYYCLMCFLNNTFSKLQQTTLQYKLVQLGNKIAPIITRCNLIAPSGK